MAVWSWALCCSSFSGCWQSSYKLDHNFLCKILSMRCHVELPMMSIRECKSDNTKFNTPAPHLHLRPCNTNGSHDTREGKWVIGLNLDIFTWGVLTFVACGLDIDGCVLSYFEGIVHLHYYISCTLPTLCCKNCYIFRLLPWKDKDIMKNFKTHFCDILYVSSMLMFLSY